VGIRWAVLGGYLVPEFILHKDEVNQYLGMAFFGGMLF
jgi:hypothetical protein